MDISTRFYRARERFTVLLVWVIAYLPSLAIQEETELPQKSANWKHSFYIRFYTLSTFFLHATEVKFTLNLILTLSLVIP